MSGAIDETGPTIKVNAGQLYAQALAALELARCMRDRALAGPRQDIAGAMVAQRKLRALLAVPMRDDEGGDFER